MGNAIKTKFIILMTGINVRERQKAALALANALSMRGITAIFALFKNSLFRKFFTDRGYEVIDAEPFPEGRGFFSNILKSIKLQSYSQQAAKILEIKSVNAVLSLGGMSAAPFLDAASKMKKVKLFLMEQNAVFSKCNSDFANRADKIYLPFEETQSEFDAQRSLAVGIPVDKEILRAKPVAIDSKKKRLCISTCKKNPRSINDLIRNLIIRYPEITSEFYIIHETGDKEIASIQRFYESKKIDALCEMFYDNRGSYYKAADIVVARPQSDIVSELIALRKTGVFFPLPENKDPYQKSNAIAMAKMGCGLLIEDIKSGNPSLKLRKLFSFLTSYLRDEEARRKIMGDLDFENSASRMAVDIEKILTGGK